MQKVNFLTIVRWHLATLREDDGRLSKSDLATFYGLPIALGIAFALLGWKVPKEAFDMSITVFSIFAALLLSVQVALYSVSLRPLSTPDDPKKEKSFEEHKKYRGTLIRELNDNISYLVLLAVILVTILLGLFVIERRGAVVSGFMFAAYAHFFLTLLMVVKRASIVFSREFEDRQ